MKRFYPSPINEISADECFQAKREFHWNQRPRAFHPVCFSSALHSSGPACYPTLNQSFFPALYASSPSFQSFHPFVPLHFHLIHPFIMLCLGWLPACSHNHRETLPLWQIMCPGRTHCTGEKNKCCFFIAFVSSQLIFFKLNSVEFKALIEHKTLKKNLFYLVGSKSSSQKYEIKVERIIESDVAKPFSMLSAYLMTAAITSPPRACGT